jgi:hypothetical protein
MEKRQKIALDVLTVREPCTEDWNAMRGGERVRFCGLCHRNVFNLSAMTRPEAEAILAEREGRLCVRFYKRADGTVTTSDCAPDRLAAARRKARRTFVWAGVMAGGFFTALGLAGVASLFGYRELMIEHVEKALDPFHEREVMGEMPMMEPPPPIDTPVAAPEGS